MKIMRMPRLPLPSSGYSIRMLAHPRHLGSQEIGTAVSGAQQRHDRAGATSIAAMATRRARILMSARREAG
jgi:hypothetical protein